MPQNTLPTTLSSNALIIIDTYAAPTPKAYQKDFVNESAITFHFFTALIPITHLFLNQEN